MTTQSASCYMPDAPWSSSLPRPTPTAPNLGCAGFLLRQLLQLWPLLLEGVQHLLVANHLLEVPFVACIGVGSHRVTELQEPGVFRSTLPQNPRISSAS